MRTEIMYGISSVWIVIALFIAILVANELAYRFAKRPNLNRDEGVTTQTNTIQAGVLGLLALLMGFSFNMALQRFDARSAAVIDESNAIGTAYLRTELLPEPHAARMQELLAGYVDLRIQASVIDLSDYDRYDAMVGRTLDAQSELWRVAMEAADSGQSSPAIVGLFVNALNDLIDSYGSRQAQLQKHVPEVVLFLLFVIFIVSGSLLGFAAGLSGSRPMTATVSMAILIVLVIFIVIDLDRPRRGLIQVDQSGMTSLQQQLAG